MDPIPIFDINLSKDATIIFTLLNQFKHTTEKNKRSFELDDLPQRIEFIPWRRVYKLLAAENINYYNRDHWDAGEMSFSGTGALWCFTELQRSGENVTRKTEDGQSWSGKTGRLPKKGYPSEILVAKLVISSKEFHMLEHTLNEERPTVALCKIWRGGTSTVASPETEYPNVFSPVASTSQQVLEEDHGFIDEGITGMQIEQPQGQLEAIAQQHVPSSALSMSGYILLENYKGSVRSIGQDDNSTYQDSISFLHDTKESFAMLNGDEGHNIASLAKNLASCFTNALHRTLGIVTAPETNRPSTSNNTQLMEAEAVGSTANPDEIPPLPETVTQDDFIMDPDPDLDLDQFEGFSMVDIDSYLNDIA